MNKYIILISLALILSACNDWFDIKPKGDGIDEERLFSDEDAFLNALAGIYTQLRENTLYGENLSVSSLEFMAQNFVPDTDKSKSLASYEYSTPENQEMIRNIWRDMYNAIAECNKTLEHILTTGIVFNFSNQREIITGELYALRGALHFELLRMFHPALSVNPGFKGMPYMTTFGTGTSEALSTGELLECIIKDLKQAAKLLYNTDPLFLASNTSSDDQPGKISRKLRTFHMNYYAVTAELSRIYLYKKEYQEALNYADSTFNHIRKMPAAYQVFYYFGPGKYNSDKSFSREHIFGIASRPDGLTQVAENLFETRKVEAREDFTATYPSVKDTRYRDWFSINPDKPGHFIMSEKFSRESLLSDYTSTTSEAKELPVRIPFIKLGEVALIAAEALNELNRTGEAAEWVIELQNNRDISFVKDLKAAAALTKENLKQEIRNEYQREFYGEGQLFFFYKRMNDTRITRYDGTVLNMPAENYTFPIPADGLSVK